MTRESFPEALQRTELKLMTAGQQGACRCREQSLQVSAWPAMRTSGA